MSTKDTDRKEIVQKGIYNVSSVILFLEELVAGLRKGAVYIHNDSEAIVLKPQGFVEIEVKAVEKANKSKLELEMEWLVATDEGQDSIGLKVSTAKPEFLSAQENEEESKTE